MSEVNNNNAGERELVLVSILDAPREAVFAAWTDPKQLPEWWGPHGMTTPVCEIDLKPGGKFLTVMRTADGTEYPTNGVFLEVTPPERIVFTDAFLEGWIPTEEPFMTAIITLEDLDGKTKCTAISRHRTVADREKHEQMGFYTGWGEMFERLNTHLTR